MTPATSMLCRSAPSKTWPWALSDGAEPKLEISFSILLFITILPCHSVSARLALRGTFSPEKILHVMGSLNAMGPLQ